MITNLNFFFLNRLASFPSSPGTPCLHNFNVHVLEHGGLGTRLIIVYFWFHLIWLQYRVIILLTKELGVNRKIYPAVSSQHHVQ